MHSYIFFAIVWMWLTLWVWPVLCMLDLLLYYYSIFAHVLRIKCCLELWYSFVMPCFSIITHYHSPPSSPPHCTSQCHHTTHYYYCTLTFITIPVHSPPLLTKCFPSLGESVIIFLGSEYCESCFYFWSWLLRVIVWVF